jgi:hypothetical protein
MYLDAILVDEPLIGGLAPRLGKAHLRTLRVMGFPSITCPGILDDLNRMAIPYRCCTRAITLDKTDAVRVLRRTRRQWFAKRKSLMALLREQVTNESSALLDSDRRLFRTYKLWLDCWRDTAVGTSTLRGLVLAARPDMRSRTVQAFWAMHMEALNWCG